MTTHQTIVTVTLNPAIDQTLVLPGFTIGKVNRVSASRIDAGGKGVNVASYLADFGIQVIVTGFLGAGNSGIFDALFLHHGFDDRFVRLPGSTRIGIKIVDELTQQTTDINSPGLAPRPEEIETLLGQITRLVEPGRWFVLSGSAPAGTPDDIYARIIELIHAGGGQVMLDTSGPPLRKALAARPELLKPNVDELGELAGRKLDSLKAVREAAAALLEQGARVVVVSMGGEGALFMDREQALLARPPKVEVKSTVGAGDAMVSGIMYAMLRGPDLEEMARMGAASGAYAVARVGAGIDDHAEHQRLKGLVEIERLERQNTIKA